MRRIVLASLFALPLLGCSQGSPAPEVVDTAQQPIIGGTQDTTHKFAVALLSNNSECTGSIVQVAGGNGYVLTAGHCCQPNDIPIIATLENDYNNYQGGVTYNVVANTVTVNPAFDINNVGAGYDFCMMQIANVDAATPTVAPMTPAQDGLAVGSQVDIVGYGLIDNMGMNSVRRHVNKNLGQVDPMLIWIDNSQSGTCEGDSGGPWLDTASNTVAGVTSFGNTKSCSGQGAVGAAGRVSAVYNSFIQPYLNNMPAQPDCNTCATQAQNNQCSSQVATCKANSECVALAQCIQGCKDQACVNTCAQQHQSGVNDYNAIDNCICKTACVTECAAQCGGSSSSSSSTSSTGSSSTGSSSSGNTSSGNTTSSSGNTSSGNTSSGNSSGAGGGNTSSGAGGGNSSGGTDNGNSVVKSGCSTSGLPGGDGTLAFLAGLAVVAGSIRRRRS